MMMPEMLTYPERAGPRKKKSSRWHGPLPVSAMEKVLFQDNRYAESLLTQRLARIRTDRHRAQRLMAWQEQSFVLRQAVKETELREMGVDHVSFLPEIVMKTTEPDVRARRPFGRARRSATQLDLSAGGGDHRLPDVAARDPKTRGTRGTADSSVRSDPFLEQAMDKRVFTRLHGIDLPLYGPHDEAKREIREREFVRHLQRQQTRTKVTLDPRFKGLEQSLVQSQTDLLPGLTMQPAPLMPRVGGGGGRASLADAAAHHRGNNRGVGNTRPIRNSLATPGMTTKSAKALGKMQAELSQKPKSLFAKSVWIDF